MHKLAVVLMLLFSAYSAEVDDVEALRRACDNGEVDACNNLWLHTPSVPVLGQISRTTYSSHHL